MQYDIYSSNKERRNHKVRKDLSLVGSCGKGINKTLVIRKFGIGPSLSDAVLLNICLLSIDWIEIEVYT